MEQEKTPFGTCRRRYRILYRIVREPQIGIGESGFNLQTGTPQSLDAGTAFEILSIDIADIDIGRNIGAALQIDQANADKNIAQAKAEERRAMQSHWNRK